MKTGCDIAPRIESRLLARNEVYRDFFWREAPRLADACRHMSDRFLRGGRILAFGRGPYATDAQHISVEFTHPVIVGKRALPALDLSLLFRPWLETLIRSEDIVIGFGPPEGDPEIQAALESAHTSSRAMTIALPGDGGSYAVAAGTQDHFMHQEMIEILYHVLWETVHVFFEHRELGHDVGEALFLYPFLGHNKQPVESLLKQVADSIQLKVQDDAILREKVARDETKNIANVALAIWERLQAGGKLVFFGNGGSATDANDWMIDCVSPPRGLRSIPAVSLAMEPANITAIANDVGTDVIFLRQLIAVAQQSDIAVAISTSGGSQNVIMALEEARKRNMLTIALLGRDGGQIRRDGMADFTIVVPCDYIPRIQEVQASIYHTITEILGVLSHGKA